MLALLRPWSSKLLADRAIEAQRSLGRCGIVFVLHQRTGRERRGTKASSYAWLSLSRVATIEFGEKLEKFGSRRRALDASA
jgi:hypothetical protein